MSAQPTRRNDWLSPQNMIALLGMGLTVWASIQAFQRDTDGRMIRLEERVAVLEKAVDRNAARLDVIDHAQSDAVLRVDRLEHQPN